MHLPSGSSSEMQSSARHGTVPNQRARLVCVMSKISGLPAATPDWSPAISIRSRVNTEQRLSNVMPQLIHADENTTPLAIVESPTRTDKLVLQVFSPIPQYHISASQPHSHAIAIASFPCYSRVQVGKGFMANSTHGLLCFT